MNKTLEAVLLDSISSNIGLGVHTSLRKYTNSKEAMIAWNAISQMPDEEWNMIAEIVAKEILKEISPLIKG